MVSGAGSLRSFTHYAVVVRIIHVRVSGVSPTDGSDAVAPRLGASDAAVPVVVVQLEGIAGLSSPRTGDGSRCLAWTGLLRDRHLGRRATRQDVLQHVAFAPIDGEFVSLAHLDRAVRETSSGSGREATP